MRLWVGVWIGVFMIILCAFEISAWVAFITRFTEENFALLIATIYVYKAVQKLFHIAEEYPLTAPEPKANATDCYCVPPNGTATVFASDGSIVSQPVSWIGLPPANCSEVV